MITKKINLPSYIWHKTLVLCTDFEKKYFIEGETDFLSAYKNKTVRNPCSSIPQNENFEEVIAMQYPSRLKNLVCNQLSFFNTEQLTSQRWSTMVQKECSMLQGQINYYDYSTKNMEIFATLNLKNFIPKLILLEPRNINYLHRLRLSTPKVYDFVFIGHLTPYRQNIVNRLRQNNYTISTLDNVWGTQRDKQIMKAYNILNIPQSEEFKIFELSRNKRILLCGMPVYTLKNHYLDLPNDPLIIDLQPLLNNASKKLTILIRTNKRPIQFKRQMDLVTKQKPDRIIVSVHNEESLQYVQQYGIPHQDIVYIDESTIQSKSKFKYNLYMNYLIKHSDLDTFLWMIDDDDTISETAIDLIRSECTDDNTLYFVRNRRGTERCGLAGNLLTLASASSPLHCTNKTAVDRTLGERSPHAIHPHHSRPGDGPGRYPCDDRLPGRGHARARAAGRCLSRQAGAYRRTVRCSMA